MIVPGLETTRPKSEVKPSAIDKEGANGDSSSLNSLGGSDLRSWTQRTYIDPCNAAM